MVPLFPPRHRRVPSRSVTIQRKQVHVMEDDAALDITPENTA